MDSINRNNTINKSKLKHHHIGFSIIFIRTVSPENIKKATSITTRAFF